MTAKAIISSAAAQAADKLYVDDVFSTYLYTGTGTTQTITNGIDLAGNGGMVWQKCRDLNQAHYVVDTARGNTKWLMTQGSEAEQIAPGTTNVKSFDSTGFTLGGNYTIGPNASGRTYASWTFRKAPKFFDVATFTTNASGVGSFSHSLGAVPGMVIFKRTNAAAAWFVYHRSLSTTSNYLFLNGYSAQGNMGSSWYSATSTTVTAGLSAVTPFEANSTYVAYLFAHDTATDGLIQCGSYTGNGSATGPTVTLGWEPQYLMVKNASGTGSWVMLDTMRGFNQSNDAAHYANASDVEYASMSWATPTSTGFDVQSSNANINSSGAFYIYLAIRRPNKPPTSGTQVCNATRIQDVNNLVQADFPVDLVIQKSLYWNVSQTALTGGNYWHDRLRGAGSYIKSDSTAAESTSLPTFHVTGLDSMTGVKIGSYAPNADYAHFWMFRRAPGFFDVVCYTGTGAARTVNHNLGVAPELMIVKKRSVAEDWRVYHASIGAANFQILNQATYHRTGDDKWNGTQPSASVFSVGIDSGVNTNAATYVAYLFASCPGISKVGSYTGNGTSQTIDCGFAAGARFVLIKRTDSTGDWYVWDSSRGIVAANDPHLSLNTSAAEVTTDDSIDPANSGFVVNQVGATNINVPGSTYIFLAIA